MEKNFGPRSYLEARLKIFLTFHHLALRSTYEPKVYSDMKDALELELGIEAPLQGHHRKQIVKKGE
jgi:hypothetical protein